MVGLAWFYWSRRCELCPFTRLVCWQQSGGLGTPDLWGDE
jgi:hypothetical protein